MSLIDGIYDGTEEMTRFIAHRFATLDKERGFSSGVVPAGIPTEQIGTHLDEYRRHNPSIAA
jgi:hypothetical protein